jgi:hypothetical protein
MIEGPHFMPHQSYIILFQGVPYRDQIPNIHVAILPSIGYTYNNNLASLVLNNYKWKKQEFWEIIKVHLVNKKLQLIKF